MSRLTGNELSGLMEAYASVGKKKKKKVMHDCATHGEHAEWGVGSMIKEMHTLDEEGNITHYDVEFEHGIERNVPVEDLEILVSEAHEHYMNDDKNAEVLDEAPMTAFQAAGGQAKLDQINKNRGPRQGRATAADLEKQGQENLFKAGGGNAAIAKGPQRNAGRGGMRPVLTRQDIINKGTVAAAKPTAKPAAATPAARPATAPAARPAAAAPAAKPVATAAPKPTTPAAPAKPAGSAMDQWAKANPKLAAAKAERDRTRGTSATTNPLMKDMKSSLPAPKSPSPSTASTAFGLAKKGVNLAAGVDIFDLVKGHLLDEGYAETEEGAMVIMVNMSEEWRKSILEAHGVELDEAQRARENPEDHDKEEKRKYEPVRGERTPMPPRGDKRREDFEKWYAKQMGR